MAIAYLDCPTGISGDMLLGALIDAGLSADVLRKELATLPVDGYRLEAVKTARAGLAATKATVTLDGTPQPHRKLDGVLALIEGSRLPDGDKERSGRVFSALASAEAEVHGVGPNDVEFHEVGAVDAIVDVAGTVAGLRLLDIQQLYCSPLPVGGGWAQSDHGRLPVPAPAALKLLANAGAPLRPAPDIEMELVTPTGAALVATLARFERPPMTVRAVGAGAGGREIDGVPNAARLWVGDALDEPAASVMQLLETNIDDMTPELLAYAQERLLTAGAADVWLTPVQMKKGRNGFVLSVLCTPEREHDLAALILRETTTLGVRVRGVERHVAEREEVAFESSLGPAAVKVKRLAGRPPHIAPEYEVCAKIARERNLPLQEVYSLIEREARDFLERDA